MNHDNYCYRFIAQPYSLQSSYMFTTVKENSKTTEEKFHFGKGYKVIEPQCKPLLLNRVLVYIPRSGWPDEIS